MNLEASKRFLVFGAGLSAGLLLVLLLRFNSPVSSNFTWGLSNLFALLPKGGPKGAGGGVNDEDGGPNLAPTVPMFFSILKEENIVVL